MAGERVGRRDGAGVGRDGRGSVRGGAAGARGRGEGACGGRAGGGAAGVRVRRARAAGVGGRAGAGGVGVAGDGGEGGRGASASILVYAERRRIFEWALKLACIVACSTVSCSTCTIQFSPRPRRYCFGRTCQAKDANGDGACHTQSTPPLLTRRRRGGRAGRW